jgi:hypothetical protein
MMRQCQDVFDTPDLEYEEWRDLLRTLCGRYNPEGVEAKAFSGWVRPRDVCGFTALDMGCNAPRIERTYRDARLDTVDNYFAVFQVGGQSDPSPGSAGRILPFAARMFDLTGIVAQTPRAD